MPDGPLFTVLLPTNGRAEVIGASIQSILGQTVQDFELIVVGDGCEDDTGAVVQSFSDSRITWIDLPKGPGFGYANRNQGLGRARGEIIAYAQHDDIFLHDHLELLARPFRANAVYWAHSRPLWVDDAGKICPFYVNLKEPQALKDFTQHRNVIPSNCVAHRSCCLAEIGLWDDTLAKEGDWEYWKRIAAKYGPRALTTVRVPTSLHFRARWRSGPGWPLPHLQQMAALAQTSPFWPRALKLEIDPAGPEPQVQVMDRLAADPPGFARRIRSGVEILQDALAWSAIRDPLRV